MHRTNGGMASPRLLALAALSLLATCSAGPLPLANVTSTDLGLKEGGCAVGDVVYLPGDEFPGASACERCRCARAGGGVSCARVRCEPRPGCKALHRPDHCCPTYQCECEQEGRVYGNGEKLVDPADPCRVCYCQGGEVVCRRIACFLRDDCSPRLVPGRCCPEYDNCPLRGVTTISGATPSISTAGDEASSPAPPPSREIKQNITIKEITPVSEIPVIPEVKIKEILPSPGIEVPNYFSSKSPLIVREATTENVIFAGNEEVKHVKPSIVELPAPSAQPIVPSEIPTVPTQQDIKNDDVPPSKISLSTLDHEIYSSIASSIPTMGVPAINPNLAPALEKTKAPVVEEEDTSSFDHNPAFPPIPDDLSVLSNHEDEPDQIDNEHVLIHEATSEAVEPHSEPETKISAAPVATYSIVEVIDTNSKIISDITPAVTFVATETPSLNTNYEISTVKTDNPLNSPSTTSEPNTPKLENIFSTDTTKVKDSPMLNLRSAIPTEILDVPSSLPEEIDGKLDDITEPSSVLATVSTESIITTENVVKEVDKLTKAPQLQKKGSTTTTTLAPLVTTQADIQTSKSPETPVYVVSTQPQQEQTSSSQPKSNIVTEITAQTEFSSLPIETSDQKPKEKSEVVETETLLTTNANPSPVEYTTAKIKTPSETEIITVSKSVPPSTENFSSENIETTEFIIKSFGSSESATDTVELIKISAEPEKSAAIIQSNHGKKNSVLMDLRNLVGDVAAIGDTEATEPARREPTAPASPAYPSMAATIGISESEELIPVNAGYKSKNSNWNVNSITEVPIKSKASPSVTKQKVVEIEDDEGESITDLPAPDDKVEPTTRRPIIDRVSDDARHDNRTEKKDIEIITKSYVPTLNRRPTKVVMKKNNEQAVTEDVNTETETMTAQPATATQQHVTTTAAAVAASAATTATTASDAAATTPATDTTSAATAASAAPVGTTV